MKNKNKNKGSMKVSLILTALLISVSNSITAFAVEDPPPSFNVTIPADDSESTTTDPPPSFNVTIPSDETSTGDKIEITNADVFPKGFNPKIGKTKISYELNLKAKIDVKIIDNTGQTVATLIDNQAVDAGKYYIEWNGTKNNQAGGELLGNGSYRFKIDAKNQTSGAIEDTAQGDVSIIYPANTTNPSSVENKTTTTSSSQSAATVAVQNAQSGKTAETGPGILIYTLLPLGAFILKRKKKYGESK